MKHFILTFLAFFAGVFATKAQTLEYYLDEENQIVYQYYPGTGIAEVAHGTRYESDLLPQVSAHHNRIGEVVRIIEGFEVDGVWYSVEAIGGHAFFGLTNIKTVYIPKTIRRIDEISFAGCSGIEDVYCEVNPWKLVWSTGNYYDYYDFKKGKGTKFHVHPDYYDMYLIRFGTNNVTFVPDMEFEADVEPEGTTTYFRGYDAETGRLIAAGDGGDWWLEMPSDGSTIELVADGYWGEEGLYFRLGKGTSSVKDITLRTNFAIHGVLHGIRLWAAGDIRMLRYRLTDGSWVEKQFTNDGGWKDFYLEISPEERVDGEVEFHVYSATPFVLQNIMLVYEESEPDYKYSTFKDWVDVAAPQDNIKAGTILTEEGVKWDAILSNPTVNVVPTTVGYDGVDGTNCLVFFADEGDFSVEMEGHFRWKGPVEKIVVRASGNLYQLRADFKEQDASTGFGIVTQTVPTGDFRDYVIHVSDCPDYELGIIRITASGTSPIYIHSITIFDEDKPEELPHGQCGDNLFFTMEYIPDYFVQDQETYAEIPAAKLTITGSGDMWDFDPEWTESINRVPWVNFRWNIVQVELPSGMTSVGNNAFSRLWNCLFSDLPDGIRRVGQSAFYNNRFQEVLTLPAELERIESSAFKGINFTKKLVVGPKVSYIAPGAISSIYNLDYYEVDDANPYFNDYGHCVYEPATATVIAGGKKSFIPSGAKIIGQRAFENGRMESIDLPLGLETIDDYAFSGSNLKEIDVHDMVTSIGNYAFSNCRQLLNVTLGTAVTSVGQAAFESCPNMLDIVLYPHPESLTWKSYSGNARMFGPDKKTTAHVRPKDLEKWETDFAFLNLNFVPDISEELKPIEEEKVIDFTALTGVNLSNKSVDNIYYNLDPTKGSGCIDGALVIGTFTDMSLVGSGEPGTAEVTENFNGIILKVNGKGTITVDSRAFGNRLKLAIRIGNGTPVIIPETGRQSNMISYNVQTETYVYIYAVPVSASVRGQMFRAEGVDEDSVVIYGIKIEPGAGDPDGIITVDEHDNRTTDSPIYDLNGRRLIAPKKGINVIRYSDGTSRKVLIK